MAATTTPGDPVARKLDLADALARTEPSVFFGDQTEAYWQAAYRRMSHAELVRLTDKRLDTVTGPDMGGAWTMWQAAAAAAL